MSPGLHGADSRPQVLLHSGEQLSPAPLPFSQGLAASSRNTCAWLQSSGGLTTAKQPSPRLFIQGQHLSPQLHATAQTRLWSHSASHRTPSPNQPGVPRQGLSRNGSVCPEVFYLPHVADPIPGRTPLEAPPQVPAGWDALGVWGRGLHFTHPCAPRASGTWGGGQGAPGPKAGHLTVMLLGGGHDTESRRLSLPS